MTNPTPIPEEVMEVARQAADELFGIPSHPTRYLADSVEIIARAFMPLLDKARAEATRPLVEALESLLHAAIRAVGQLPVRNFDEVVERARSALLAQRGEESDAARGKR